MQNEFVIEQRKLGEEKRATASSYATAEQNQAAKHREKMSEQRSTIASLEDHVVRERERYRELERDKLVLIQQETVAKQKNESLVELSTNLTRDLEVSRQNLSASQSAHNLTGNKHNDSSNNKNSPAVNHSQLRLLSNKVEYLKAQLISEVSAKDECFTKMYELKKDKENLISSQRLRTRELEEKRKNEIRSLKKKIRESSERPVKEISELQGQIAKLNAQISDAIQGIAKAKKTRNCTEWYVIRDRTERLFR